MTSEIKAASDYLTQSRVLYSAQQVELAISGLAQSITKALATENPMVIAVMGGAIVFAGKLLPKLNFPLTFDFVQASRYHNETSGRDLVWGVEPKQAVKDKTILLLDDILDEGITLQAIRDKCLALGAKKVMIAVLVEKELNQQKPINADFIGLKVPNQYVFGYGMDVYGWWRNLEEIRIVT